MIATNGRGSTMLEASGLTKYFGGVAAVKEVDFAVEAGQVVGLIGPNGAGKTTIFNLLSGAEKPSAGTITFQGQPIGGQRPSAICQRGLARTFQIVRPLARLTVLENVMTGAYCRVNRTSEARGIAVATLEFTGLLPKKDTLARNLTIADRKRLEITRALATQPRLLLLDEVMAGLNPTETEEAILLIQRIRERGITLVVIEHVMRVIMAISDVIMVLHHGEKIASGPPQQVAHDPAVISAYLGEAYA